MIFTIIIFLQNLCLGYFQNPVLFINLEIKTVPAFRYKKGGKKQENAWLIYLLVVWIYFPYLCFWKTKNYVDTAFHLGINKIFKDWSR